MIDTLYHRWIQTMGITHEKFVQAFGNRSKKKDKFKEKDVFKFLLG